MISVREQVQRHFALEARAREPDDELADGLYGLLYSIDLEDVSVDGWDYFRVVRESKESLDAVGLMALLPSGSVPIQISVKGHESGFTWSMQIARVDPVWRALSDSKRWNSVYLYAAGEHEMPQWTWGQQYHGSVDRADA